VYDTVETKPVKNVDLRRSFVTMRCALIYRCERWIRPVAQLTGDCSGWW